MDKPVVVVGGTGRLGRRIVTRLLDRGETVHVIGRSRERALRSLPTAAVFHQGDVRVPASLPEPLSAASAVVYCVEPGTDESGPDRPQATMQIGVENVLAAAVASAARPHVVLVSHLHTTHQGHPLNAYGGLMQWRLAGEEAVRRSDLPYTVVRPGWLTDEPVAGRGVRLEQGDRGDGQVTREDVAEACVQALYHPSAVNVTFEVFNHDSPAPARWVELFDALEWDPTPVA